MPIYEYQCRACGQEFEHLVRPPATTSVVECPSCQSREVEQVLSAFSVNTPEKSKAVWKAARKKFEQTTLRDKKVVEAEDLEKHH